MGFAGYDPSHLHFTLGHVCQISLVKLLSFELDAASDNCNQSECAL
jgi:hypothetical protein